MDNDSSLTIRKLFRKGQPLVFARHSLIPNDDPTHRGIYLIDSGFVKVYSISDEGEEYVHIMWGPGELFPLSWAYLEVPADTELFYEALSDCVVWRLSRDWLAYFITNSINISNAAAIQLARQLEVLADRVNNLEHRKADKRLVYHLLFLAHRFGRQYGDNVVIDAPITHELLANSVNLARESVSRTFERLSDQGIISRTNHRIIITDRPRLKSYLTASTNSGA